MPHDPILIADTKAWLKKAGNDLRAATIDLDADPPRSSWLIAQSINSKCALLFALYVIPKLRTIA